jgi:hypothetical protein
MTRATLLAMSVLVFTGCHRPEEQAAPAAGAAPMPANPLTGRIVDLTHAFGADTIYWPTEKGFQFERGNNGITAKGYYYAANRFSAAEHGGTHLDAPIHFADGKKTADEVPLERLVGEAAGGRSGGDRCDRRLRRRSRLPGRSRGIARLGRNP